MDGYSLDEFPVCAGWGHMHIDLMCDDGQWEQIKLETGSCL